jgi:hypothetical protein
LKIKRRKQDFKAKKLFLSNEITDFIGKLVKNEKSPFKIFLKKIYLFCPTRLSFQMKLAANLLAEG